MNIKKYTLPLLGFLILVVGGVGYFYYQKAAALKATPEALARQDAIDTIARVSKIIVLPEGEVPTVATIDDPSKLRGQIFFAKAKVGDKVLLYTQAKKAFLYDPVANKILEVAPVTLDAAPAKTTTKK